MAARRRGCREGGLPRPLLVAGRRPAQRRSVDAEPVHADGLPLQLTADPCEYNDISSEHPDIVTSMAARLANYSTVPPLVGKGCMPQIIDIAGTDGPALQFLPCDVPAASFSRLVGGRSVSD